MDAAKNDARAKLQIPIWGPTNTGKTTYLASLYLALKGSDWDVWPDDAKSFRFIDDQAHLLQQGKFGAPNPVNVPPTSYALNITRLNPRHGFLGSKRVARLLLLGRRVIRLTVWDAPGEVFENPLSKEETFYEIARFRTFFDAIRSASGVICLLDLETNSTDSRVFYHQFIRRTLFVLQRDSAGKVLRQVQRPIVWGVTKIDLPGRWGYRDDPREYAIMALGEDLVKEMERTCTHCIWQAISSVGVIPDATGRQVVSNYDHVAGQNPTAIIKDPLQREPFHVVEPVTWILEQMSWWWRRA
jgi:hypothetical protein